ncbi:hypothetical protein NFI96_026194 [Prochilodus magdalenae]|nr:hypothetical protein NFI96_026194 [Prochilodus magdalenae]
MDIGLFLQSKEQVQIVHGQEILPIIVQTKLPLETFIFIWTVLVEFIFTVEIHDLQLLMCVCFYTEHFTLTGPCGIDEQSGSVVTLSCHLSPELSAVTMEIRWFKGTECVCLYKSKQVTEGRGYEGRVSLFTEELQRGNISLRIRDCRESDLGVYLCQVTNGDTTEECTVVVWECKYPEVHST